MIGEKPLENMVSGYSNTSIFRTIAFIGDSLSSGQFETVDADGKHNYYNFYEYSWGQFIARKNGLTAYNFSYGGLTTKSYIENFAEENGFWDPDKACQAYVIALGVNDIYSRHMPIGEAKDITATEFDGERPFISYYAEIVRRYKEIQPDAKFFFVTFPHEPKRDQAKTKGMVDALYALADHFDNCYVINLYEYGPVYDEAFKETYFLYGHMNPMGYIFTANLVDSYIDYIIRTNPSDFKTVGFIGTNIKYK